MHSIKTKLNLFCLFFTAIAGSPFSRSLTVVNVFTMFVNPVSGLTPYTLSESFFPCWQSASLHLKCITFPSLVPLTFIVQILVIFPFLHVDNSGRMRYIFLASSHEDSLGSWGVHSPYLASPVGWSDIFGQLRDESDFSSSSVSFPEAVGMFDIFGFA